MQPVLIVHGGAGDISDDRVEGKYVGVKRAVREGFKILQSSGSSIDAVEIAVRIMEMDENFNAGYGSVLNIDGDVEMEASIMEGKTLKAGCVSLAKNIMHPISLARLVMEKTNHTYLAGNGLMEFATANGFKVMPDGCMITPRAQYALNEFKKRKDEGLDTMYSRTELDRGEPVGVSADQSCNKELGEPGTVGAVCIDSNGDISVATSTGGITGKLPGRIGDTPLLGCGTYADNRVGGVSTTGHGETIMRFNLASRILEKMNYENVDPEDATAFMTRQMTARLKGTGGAITISKDGNVGIGFSSKRMAWAYIKNNELHFGVNKGENIVEDFFL